MSSAIRWAGLIRPPSISRPKKRFQAPSDEPQDFFAPRDAQTAHNALKVLLSGNGKASEALTKTMTPSDQQIMQDVYHKQRESLAPAILDEIDKRRRAEADQRISTHAGSALTPLPLCANNGAEQQGKQ